MAISETEQFINTPASKKSKSNYQNHQNDQNLKNSNYYERKVHFLVECLLIIAVIMLLNKSKSTYVYEKSIEELFEDQEAHSSSSSNSAAIDATDAAKNCPQEILTQLLNYKNKYHEYKEKYLESKNEAERAHEEIQRFDQQFMELNRKFQDAVEINKKYQLQAEENGVDLPGQEAAVEDDDLETSTQTASTVNVNPQKPNQKTTTTNKPFKPIPQSPRKIKFNESVPYPGQPTYQKTAALIVTETRSGSSFLGEIFNMHPDVFYLYEPLLISPKHYENSSGGYCSEYFVAEQLLDRGYNGNGTSGESMKSYEAVGPRKKTAFAEIMKIKNMKDPISGLDMDVNLLSEYLANCKIPNPSKNIKLTPKIKPARLAILKNCIKNGFCFPPKHSFLQSHPFDALSVDLSNVTEEKNKFYSNYCKNEKKVAAAKVVRLCSLEEVLPIFLELEKAKVNLQVIYLVRDPRGIFNSRWSLKFTNTVKKSTDIIKNIPATHCMKMDGNIRYYESALNSASPRSTIYEFIKNHVNFIKYEDVASHPLELTEKIYQTVGLKLTEDIKNQITRITSGKSSNAQDAINRSRVENAQAKLEASRHNIATSIGRRKRREIFEKLEKTGTKLIYGYAMNSSEVAQHWRNNYKWSAIETAQDDNVCGRAMKYFGYKIYESREDWDRNGRRR